MKFNDIIIGKGKPSKESLRIKDPEPDEPEDCPTEETNSIDLNPDLDSSFKSSKTEVTIHVHEESFITDSSNIYNMLYKCELFHKLSKKFSKYSQDKKLSLFQEILKNVFVSTILSFEALS